MPDGDTRTPSQAFVFLCSQDTEAECLAKRLVGTTQVECALDLTYYGW
jgi:hypothetical protein